MKIGWIKYALVCLMVFASGAALMVISHRAHNAQRRIATLEKSISQENENIRVLAAEWSYLNNPERLESLAVKYLDLKVAEPAQLVSRVDSVEEDLAAEDVVTEHPGGSVYAASYTPSEVVSVVTSRKPKSGIGGKTR